jgi:hypothetical protein
MHALAWIIVLLELFDNLNANERYSIALAKAKVLHGKAICFHFLYVKFNKQSSYIHAKCSGFSRSRENPKLSKTFSKIEKINRGNNLCYLEITIFGQVKEQKGPISLNFTKHCLHHINNGQ